jgi:hypothetical protein
MQENLSPARASIVREDVTMATHTQLTDLEIHIARYRRLADEVTDPLAVSLLELVIRDLEANQLEASQKG